MLSASISRGDSPPPPNPEGLASLEICSSSSYLFIYFFCLFCREGLRACMAAHAYMSAGYSTITVLLLLSSEHSIPLRLFLFFLVVDILDYIYIALPTSGRVPQGRTCVRTLCVVACRREIPQTSGTFLLHCAFGVSGILLQYQ